VGLDFTVMENRNKSAGIHDKVREKQAVDYCHVLKMEVIHDSTETNA